MTIEDAYEQRDADWRSESPIRFQVSSAGTEKEVLRIEPDGTVLLHERHIGTDQDIFEALQKWAKQALGKMT